MELKLDVVEALISKERIEEGKWRQLRSFIIPTGEEEGPLLFRDPPKNEEPVRIRMRSVRSDYFRKRELNATISTQAKANRTKASEREALVATAMSAERARRFSWLCTGLENFSAEAPMQTPTEDDLFAMASQGSNQWIVDQGMSLAFTDSEYGSDEELARAALGNGSGDEETQPAAAPSPARKDRQATD